MNSSLRIALTLGLLGFELLPVAAHAQAGLVAVEILPVAEDGLLPDLEQRHAEVALDHGIAPLADWMARAADGRALHVRLWRVPDGAALEALGRDERCGAHEGHGWLLTKARELALQPGELAWIELVVPRDGYGLREQAEIDRAMAPLAQRYGIRRQSSLIALTAANGPWQGVAMVEFWAVPSLEAFERLRRDPQWRQLADRLQQMRRPHAFSGMLAETR